MNASLGKHCQLWYGAVVSHDNQLGEFYQIGPNATLSGYVKLGDGCFIGQGAQILQTVELASGVVVPAGAIVKKSVSFANSYLDMKGKPIWQYSSSVGENGWLNSTSTVPSNSAEETSLNFTGIGQAASSSAAPAAARERVNLWTGIARCWNGAAELPTQTVCIAGKGEVAVESLRYLIEVARIPRAETPTTPGEVTRKFHTLLLHITIHRLRFDNTHTTVL